MSETDRLRRVFRTALSLPGDHDVDSLEYRSIASWDSIAHMSLVAAIEDEFGIMLDTDEVLDLSTFGTAVSLLNKHGVRVE